LPAPCLVFAQPIPGLLGLDQAADQVVLLFVKCPVQPNPPSLKAIDSRVCGTLAGPVTLELCTVALPVTTKATKRIEVVRPNDVVFVQKPGTNTFQRVTKQTYCVGKSPGRFLIAPDFDSHT